MQLGNTPEETATINREVDVSAYVAMIAQYEKDADSFVKKGRQIVKRFRDENTLAGTKKRQYNMLYANVDLLKPALYAQAPKPQIERRFRDSDKVGRVACDVLERVLMALMDNEESCFDDAMTAAVEDRLLAGRGAIWLRYAPTFKDVETPLKPTAPSLNDLETRNQPKQAAEREVDAQEIQTETIIVDYLPWEDFGHDTGRRWSETQVVWKRAYLSRSELIKRFGKELGEQIPLDSCITEDKPNDKTDKAMIYEVVDKAAAKTIWLSKTMEDKKALDCKDNPLQIEGVFPCPRPLFATTTNDKMLPVPDYTYYEDQLKELDDLTSRVRLLTKAIRVAGVYDASQGKLASLIEGTIAENKLVPVDNWAMFADKGGIKGSIDFLPIKEIAEVIAYLVDQRERVLSQIYEITGLSDIVRGVTKASETLGAQRLKSNYATLRLDVKQKQVARFAKDTIRLMAEIVCGIFSDETIRKMSNVELLSASQKQEIQMTITQAEQAQQPPNIDSKAMEMLEKPSWEEVFALLRDDAMRKFRIDIETDSTVSVDYEQEKRDRTEYITSITGFLEKALPATAAFPAVGPVVSAALLWGSRAFKQSRGLEFELENFSAALEKQSKQPPPQQQAPPSPPDNSIELEQAKQQAENQRLEAKLQVEREKIQLDRDRHNHERSMANVDPAIAQMFTQLNQQYDQTQAMLSQLLAVLQPLNEGQV
jgi:hypothetical protein